MIKRIFKYLTLLTLILTIILFLSNSLGGLNTENKIIDRNNFEPIYKINFKDIDNNEVSLSQFKNKKILIVNTASNCGFTYQYKDLQNLHKLYENKLAVIGVPSNDFMGQEPESENIIKSFCEDKYGVTFMMSEKMRVKGENKHELFDYLTDKNLNGWNDDEPSWNFNKFLIDENGYLVNKFSSYHDPLSDSFLNSIFGSKTIL